MTLSLMVTKKTTDRPVVTKDVAPYSIVGGVPAKLIWYRKNGLVYPGITATDFHNHLADGPQSNHSRTGMMPADSPESVAEKILEAVQTTKVRR